MNSKNEHIDSFLGKVLILFSLFFLLSFYNGGSTPHVNVIDSLTEQVSIFGVDAILNEPSVIPQYNPSLGICNFYTSQLEKTSYNIRCLNTLSILEIKTENEKYIQLKPRLIQSRLAPLKISTSKDLPLIL